MDETDDRDVATGENLVDVGERVRAGLRIEKVRTGQVAQPVAERDQPAHRSDVARRERHPGVAGTELRGGEVENHVVRADRDDRPVDLVEAAQQLDLDLLARVVALDAGGDDEQPVGADQRREHARAARERRRDERAADAPEAHANPIVHPDRRGELARQPRAGATRRGGAAPSSSASIGAAKMSNVSDADTG